MTGFRLLRTVLPAALIGLALAAAVAPHQARAEQTARLLRLHAEVAAEAACVSPEVPDSVAPAATMLGRSDYLAYCRCFARVVARNRPPVDQQELIETRGVPPVKVAERAHAACMPGRR